MQVSRKTPDAVLKHALQGHPQRLRLPVALQRRRGGRGAAPPGQDARGRPRGRLPRLRRSRGVRQGGLHPHRLLQPGEDARARAARRLRRAHRQVHRRPDRRSRDLRRRSTSCSRPSRRRSATSSTSRSAATRSSSGCTRRGCRTRSSRSSPTTASRRARTTTPAARATTTPSSRPSGIGSVTDSLSALKELVFDRGELPLPPLRRDPRRRLRRPRAAAPAPGEQDAQVRQRRRLRRRADDADFQACCSRKSTAGRTPRAARTASRCCPRRATSTSARCTCATPDGRGEGQPVSEGHHPRAGRRPPRADGRARSRRRRWTT